MTKLGEAIRRSQRIESAPMGFGAAKQRGRPTLVVGSLGGPDKAVADALEGGAEVALLDGRKGGLDGDAVRKAAKESGDLILGGFLGAMRAEDVESLKEAGLDFVIFDPGSTLAGALLDEDLDYVLQLPADTDEAYLRSLDALNIESIFIADLSLPLSVLDQLNLARVSLLGQKPVSCEIPSDASVADLRALRSAGVRLVLVSDGAEGLKRTKETVGALPAPKGERNNRPLVSLPTGRQEEADDDEDD